MREVINSPSWRLMILEGNEVFITSKVLAGDQDFADHYKKMLKDPGKYGMMQS